MRLSRRHERCVYVIGGVIFVSGLGWLGDHYLFAGSAEFGERHGAFEPWWLRLHGAAMMLGLIVLGSLFPGHVARAWRTGVNRRSGLVILSVAVLLTATGWALYYIGDEDTRAWTSVVHWLVGLVSGAALVVHAWLGKRKARPLRLAARPDSAAAPPRSMASPSARTAANAAPATRANRRQDC